MTHQINKEMPATPEGLQRLRATLKQNIDMLTKHYERVLHGNESDEADITIGALGLSIKNLRMAHGILASLAARRRDFKPPESKYSTFKPEKPQEKSE
jgi:hypothetical protein